MGFIIVLKKKKCVFLECFGNIDKINAKIFAIEKNQF